MRFETTLLNTYCGPVARCKGSNSKNEQTAADQLRQQEFNLMQQQLNSANPVLDKIIANGGMMPEQQAAMQSLVMNQLPQTFNNLQGGINNALVARGITGGQMGAGSGDVARQFGQLGAMEGAMQQQGLSNIQLEKGQGLMNAVGAKLGMMGQFNSGALSAMNSGVTAANNADQASTGFWGSLLGGALGMGSSAVGKGGIFGKA